MNALMRIVGGVIFISFLPIYFFFLLFLPLTLIMSFTDILGVIRYEAPTSNIYFFMLFFISLIFYLSLRIPILRNIYNKVPVLFPLLQMLFIGAVGLAFGVFFMNLWAENAIISKPVAIVLALVSFLLARAFMSYWYKKYPISTKMYT